MYDKDAMYINLPQLHFTDEQSDLVQKYTLGDNTKEVAAGSSEPGEVRVRGVRRSDGGCADGSRPAAPAGRRGGEVVQLGDGAVQGKVREEEESEE